MKRIAAFALLLLAGAATALADDAPRPDYSKEALLSFTREVLRQRQAERIELDWGAVNIYKFGMRTRLFWLPILPLLPGSRLNDTATVPNAFALTNTPIARSMPYMGDEASSAVDREIRRIVKLEKKRRAKVKVTTQ